MRLRLIAESDAAMKTYLASYEIVDSETGEPLQHDKLPADPDPDPDEAGDSDTTHSMTPYLEHPGLASLNDRPEER